MVASRICRSRTRTRAVSLPDDRAVVGCALTALAALLLLLLAGAAKADDVGAVCWDLTSGGIECETLQSVETTCAAIAGQHEICRAVAVAQAPSAAPFAPASTKYTTVKLTRASLKAWHRYKSH